MLRRILYTSRATEGVTLHDVYDIIRVSHNRNSRAALTGGLIFLDGYFYQLLEGLPYAIDTCYERILRDKRHDEIELRLDDATSEPLFATDWMALRDGSQIEPEILAEHGYHRGMPKSAFTGEQLFALLMACFHKELAEA